MKISEDPQKSTVPGRKSVYRLLDADGENSSSLKKNVLQVLKPLHSGGVSLFFVKNRYLLAHSNNFSELSHRE